MIPTPPCVARRSLIEAVRFFRSAHQAPDAESQHECGHDNGDRLGIGAVDGEQGPLPDQLVDQCSHAGEEEDTVEDSCWNLYSRPPAAFRTRDGGVGQRGVCHTELFREGWALYPF